MDAQLLAGMMDTDGVRLQKTMMLIRPLASAQKQVRLLLHCFFHGVSLR